MSKMNIKNTAFILSLCVLTGAGTCGDSQEQAVPASPSLAPELPKVPAAPDAPPAPPESDAPRAYPKPANAEEFYPPWDPGHYAQDVENPLGISLAQVLILPPLLDAGTVRSSIPAFRMSDGGGTGVAQHAGEKSWAQWFVELFSSDNTQNAAYEEAPVLGSVFLELNPVIVVADSEAPILHNPSLLSRRLGSSQFDFSFDASELDEELPIVALNNTATITNDTSLIQLPPESADAIIKHYKLPKSGPLWLLQSPRAPAVAFVATTNVEGEFTVLVKLDVITTPAAIGPNTVLSIDVDRPAKAQAPVFEIPEEPILGKRFVDPNTQKKERE